MITKQALHFVVEEYKTNFTLDENGKGVAKFGMKQMGWFIGTEEELKENFPDTEKTQWGFLPSIYPITIMKSRDKSSAVLEAQMYFSKGFEEAKKVGADVSEYEEWIIYERNSKNSPIKCSICSTENHADKDMNFEWYCNGFMMWKDNLIPCHASYHFDDIEYKIRPMDQKNLESVCWLPDDDKDIVCKAGTCCSYGHKAHQMKEIPLKEFENCYIIYYEQCANCGVRSSMLKEGITEQMLEDRLFELFMEQYTIYTKQWKWEFRNHGIKELDEKRREVHMQIKALIDSDTMVVQRALDVADKRLMGKYNGTFYDAVLMSDDKQFRQVGIIDFADESVIYLMKNELKSMLKNTREIRSKSK